ncbi:outer membrane protein [Xanthobacter sp. AM11]|uniref:outer membrane protein n=1 Tax=Xanthobacter sp. AM11 TaxID=3380643 RepID=UPI0039BF36C9
MRARSLGFALALLTASTGGAAAAAPPPPVFSWWGGYLGLQVGYAWADAGGEDCNWARTGCPDYDTGATGLVGGAYAGFNWQISQLVLGIEGDIEGSTVSGRSSFRSPYVAYVFGHSVDETWQGSVRARLGYAVERTLVYATAGVAYGDFFNNVWRLGKSFHAYGEVRSGWTVGAGIEQAVSDNVIARLEYRYTGFESSENSFGSNSTLIQDLNLQAVRLGLAYKF